ncbi:MJ1255/VC2487 family glycosyltransferase [Shewanella sp. Isolate11]|uniref:MJ1255/VC2487 family glycosyltransferase n=1 Tax=Shewanella sp. Isolate11 TaxID=2908530 RepID=UPI001EFE493B|nr:MJ1255/VC2487 family glycosyltransferase [Shewanella sp. Isolate11]MCG9698221.1 glycosyltransferase [Shewanella sp. Isolate11]
MRILYGVQGTGNGHLSRARVMAKALKAQNVEVDFFFSGREVSHYFDMQCFGQYRAQAGLTFATHNGSVNIAKTAIQNSLMALYKDVRSLDLSGYDLVLNDFEPVSAWAAKSQGVPSVGVSHQAALQYDVPKVGNGWFNQMLLNYFAPVDVALGCHWHHFDCPILPPFVELNDDPVSYHPHDILVYLPFESAEAINQLLHSFDGYRFHVFHGSPAPANCSANIRWSGFSREKFKAMLAHCGGVISGAGFELASEALFLGKKLLVKPLRGQFEQLSNVAALELLGAADCMMSLDVYTVKRWLKVPRPAAINYPQVGDALVTWLKQGQWHTADKLCEQLWQQVDLPENWRKKSP